MTSEEAYRVLELMAIDMTGAMAGLPKNDPMVDVLSKRIQAINCAQDVLRYWGEYIRNVTAGGYYG